MKLIGFEEALGLVMREASLLASVRVPVAGCAGRVLAEPVVARCDMPPFDNSAVDGYALRREDVVRGLVEYRLAGEIRAGDGPEAAWSAGEALRIFTGAPVPEGWGAVVMQEDVGASAKGLCLKECPSMGAHVRRRGEEFREGDVVVPAGYVCTPATAAAMAACGCEAVMVVGKPRLTIIATGSELATPGSDLRAGQIYESNTVGLSAAAAALGLELPNVVRVEDDLDATVRAVRQAAESSDVIVTSGGVSVGDHDFVRPALGIAGFETVFWGVRLKPGKPVYFGLGAKEGQVCFGLPGNPLSALVCWSVLVRPYLLGMMGLPTGAASRPYVALEAMGHKPDRLEFVPGRMENGGVRPRQGGSHRVGGLASADCLIMIEEGRRDVGAGELVQTVALNWLP